MKTIFILTLVSFTTYCCGQTDSKQIKSCGTNFRQGLNDIPIDKLEAEWTKRMDELRTCLIGQVFPDFKVTTIDGLQVSNADLRNKVVLINFWFIGCAPCIKEMPMLIDINKKYRDTDFLLLSFSTDNKDKLKDFVKKRGINYAVVDDSKETIEKQFSLSFGYPTNIFLNRRGEIMEIKIGGELDDTGVQRTKMKFIETIEKGLKK